MPRISHSLMLASAAVAVALATPAAAGQKSIDVSYADLDLSTGKGKRALKDRVRSAIVKLCYTGQRDPVAAREFNECQRAAQAKAKADMDAVLAANTSGGGSSGVITVSRAIAER